MALIFSFCKRGSRDKGPGQGGVDKATLSRGDGILATQGSAICVASRLTGLVYAESRIRGVSKIVRVSPVLYSKS
jgi:hypothetical protein